MGKTFSMIKGGGKDTLDKRLERAEKMVDALIESYMSLFQDITTVIGRVTYQEEYINAVVSTLTTEEQFERIRSKYEEGVKNLRAALAEQSKTNPQLQERQNEATTETGELNAEKP